MATDTEAPTVIHRFLQLALSPDSSHSLAVDCAGDTLTYSQLLRLASSLSQEFIISSTPNPVVAIISENHPYTLALIIATWLAGGAVASLDVHAPEVLLRGMLQAVKPDLVVFPDNAGLTGKLCQELKFKTHTYTPSTYTIPYLLSKHSIITGTSSSGISTTHLPTPSDDAIHMFTSSASSVSQLKLVPIQHRALLHNAARELESWRIRSGESESESKSKAVVDVGLKKEGMKMKPTKVLGWGPFSHIMAIAHDLTVFTALPGGCYVFGAPPSSYPVSASIREAESQSRNENPDLALPLTLLQTALRTHADIFAGVPWMYARFREAIKAYPEYRSVLRGFRQLVAGGALPEESVLGWWKEEGLRVEISLGMTECGGALFSAYSDDYMQAGGFPFDDCLNDGAILKLIDEDGNESDSQGELVITSHNISRGYLNFTSDVHSPSPEVPGATTLHTGDIYELSSSSSSSSSSPSRAIRWVGRRADFIQLVSGELLDPREPERALVRSPYIERVAFVGDSFGRGAANSVCAILQVPAPSSTSPSPSPTSPSSTAAVSTQKPNANANAAAGGAKVPGFDRRAVLRAFADVNGITHPPLRVPPARILVLPVGEEIPMNRKGEIWRKKLEALFGERMGKLVRGEVPSAFTVAVVDSVAGAGGKDEGKDEGKEGEAPTETKEEVEREVVKIVSGVLGVPVELIEDGESSFAELGMDSNMATRIIGMLNARYGPRVSLSASAAHDYVNASLLAGAILKQLSGQSTSSSSTTTTARNASTGDEGDDVVIIGQAFRLPGNVNDASAFWSALLARRTDLLTDLLSPPDTRWDHASFYVPPGSPPSARTAGSINFTRMGRINVSSYDAAFFGVSPAEAHHVTPAARAVLEVALDALEDANVSLGRIRGSDAAVFVAQGAEFGYADLLYADKGFGAYDRYYGTGLADSAISGRLSYFLDVHGPGMTLNTACSGGLVALDNAVKAIQLGECETAIVCSVNVHVWPGNFGFLGANQMSSPNGRCATFSKDADGYVPSEGAVCMIVKSRRAALRDGDRIMGIVRATSVRHNGRSQGLAAPNSRAQAVLSQTVLAKAGLQPKDIDFVENHGTGTILGDMMEIQAINEVFAGSHSEENPLVLGASKTVFGHTESSAGLLGIAKVLQQFQQGVVPGIAYLDGTNISPKLETGVVPLRISHETSTLKRKGDLSWKALSLSFGFAGSIAAVVLEEYRPKETAPVANPAPSGPHLFVVSAKTEKALLAYLQSYATYCETAKEDSLADICYTASVGREHYRFRFACSCSSLSELRDRLNAAISGAQKTPLTAIVAKPRVAFAFPGQGSQWQGMARALADLDATFCEIIMEYARQASAKLGTDIMPLLFEVQADGDAKSPINETHLSQACIFVFQCAMVAWLEKVGVKPNALVSHSLGEIAASVTSKAMSFESALEFVIVRANAMKPENTNGGLMAAIRSPVEPILQSMASLAVSQSSSIAAYNTEMQHVVSGDAASVRAIVDDLSKQNVKATLLSVTQGFHSHCVDSALGPIRKVIEGLGKNIGHPKIPQFSSVEGRALGPDDRLDADYWTKQARQAVRFAPAARALLAEGNCHCVVDVGPQNVVSHLVKDSATRANSSISIVSLCDRPKTNTLNPLMQALATLFTLGVTPDFDALYAGRRSKPNKVSIPTYPWQRQRYFPSLRPSRSTVAPSAVPSASGEASLSWNVGKELHPLLSKEHTMDGVAIIPAAALAMFVSVEAKKARGAAVSVDMRILKPVLLEKPDLDVLKLEIKKESFTCSHIHAGQDKGVVCSGTLREPSQAGSVPERTTLKIESILDNEETYEKFETNLVKFGPSFQCIQRTEIAKDYAEGWIVVPNTPNATKLDFLRKMDAVLHMFGAIAPETPPELKSTGAFLPSAVNGFTLLSDDFPKRLLCRYKLPITVAPNGKRMTASFAVWSETGELLAYCTDYVVSWVPSSKPLAKQVPAAAKVVSTATVSSVPVSVTAVSVGKFVVSSLQNVLGMSEADAASLDSSTPLLSLGIDSIAFTQLRADVQTKFDVDLPMSFLGEDTLTLAELSEYIVENAKSTETDSDEAFSTTLGPTENGSTEKLVVSAAGGDGLDLKSVEEFISKTLQTVLGVSADSLDSSTPVLSLGVDSISFTQLRADVTTKYGVDLPMDFLGEDTLTLSDYAEFAIGQRSS